MGPEGDVTQMSFSIFMWNVITFGHEQGSPVTAIRAFMVLRGIWDLAVRARNKKQQGVLILEATMKYQNT